MADRCWPSGLPNAHCSGAYSEASESEHRENGMYSEESLPRIMMPASWRRSRLAACGERAAGLTSGV
jgi:hypothetical protein